MSFQHKTFWMPRDAGCLTEGEMGYDSSSRMDSKRGHQWFMDGSAPELFSSKKQATEAVNNGPVPGVSHMNVSLWDNSSGFQSVPGQLGDRLFGSGPIRTVNLVDRNISTLGHGDMHIGRKDFENQYGSDSSVGLSMSHTSEDPSSCLNFGGIRKVKVNQVRESESAMPTSIRHPFSGEDSGTITMGATYGKNGENIISLGQTYTNRNENISMGSAFSKADDNFISMGHTFNKDDGNFISMGHNYSKGDTRILSMSQPFDKVDRTFISMGPSYEKANGNVVSLQTPYNKGNGNFISMGPTYSKANENFISMTSSYNKGTGEEALSMGTTYDKVDPEFVTLGTNYERGNSGVLSMGHNYNKGEGTTISFGGFDEEPETNNPSGGIISSYDLLMGTQHSAHISEVSIQKDFVDSSADGSVNNFMKANMDNSVKGKEPKTTKKVSPNSFPSNVKSLLSTGMLDGVPVKYVSWSREKNLKGVIKGTGYLCDCDKCMQCKALNAYEFERHAGCKTKHPNNHIYFENGKTIYAVVQELKNTPQEMLFDAIQNVTGSPINQKNFRIWKASYQAATRELQRIYGTEEVIMPS